jgi:hypothetical protein
MWSLRAPFRAFLLTAAVLVAAPCATAFAVTATITGSGGEAVPLGGAPPVVRNIAPLFTLGFAADEKHYSFAVQGPAGQEAAAPLACNTTDYPRQEEAYYVGNGTYTIIARVSKNPDDVTCAETTETRFTFSIDGTTRVIAPPGVLMTAKSATASALTPYLFAVDPLRGNSRYDLWYAIDAKLGPDGGIVGEHSEAKPDKNEANENLTFAKPGRYTFVARALGSTGIDHYFTPWSPPAYVTIMAPFGVDTVLSNAHIGSVKITGNATEPTATGTITASIAKGAKGTAFRRLATLRLRSGALFTLKFKVATPGAYRVRYVYKGNANVVRGTATEVVRLRR